MENIKLPKIIALYRLERNGMIYDYLNAQTKKEARETIKYNGGIVYAILTLEEAYKLAFCTQGYYYKGFYGMLNTNNDKKAEDVSQFLSDCFFYDEWNNVEIRLAYEKTINFKKAQLEVKIAHCQAEIRQFSKWGWEDYVETWQNSIAKIEEEIAEIDKKEQEKEEMKQQTNEFANNVENMLKNEGVTIIDTEVSVYAPFDFDEDGKYDGSVKIVGKTRNGEIVEIQKFMSLWFTNVNGEYASEFELEKVIKEQCATKIDTESVENVEESLPNLGESQFMSEFESYMDMAYELAWQEEEEEEEEVSKNVEEKVSEYEVKEWDYYLDMAYEESRTYDEEEEDLSEYDEKEVARIMTMLDEEFGKYPDEILIDLSKNDERCILT